MSTYGVRAQAPMRAGSFLGMVKGVVCSSHQEAMEAARHSAAAGQQLRVMPPLTVGEPDAQQHVVCTQDWLGVLAPHAQPANTATAAVQIGHWPFYAWFAVADLAAGEPLTLDHTQSFVACNCGACGLPAE